MHLFHNEVLIINAKRAQILTRTPCTDSTFPGIRTRQKTRFRANLLSNMASPPSLSVVTPLSISRSLSLPLLFSLFSHFPSSFFLYLSFSLTTRALSLALSLVYLFTYPFHSSSPAPPWHHPNVCLRYHSLSLCLYFFLLLSSPSPYFNHGPFQLCTHTITHINLKILNVTLNRADIWNMRTWGWATGRHS